MVFGTMPPWYFFETPEIGVWKRMVWLCIKFLHVCVCVCVCLRCLEHEMKLFLYGCFLLSLDRAIKSRQSSPSHHRSLYMCIYSLAKWKALAAEKGAYIYRVRMRAHISPHFFQQKHLPCSISIIHVWYVCVYLHHRFNRTEFFLSTTCDSTNTLHMTVVRDRIYPLRRDLGAVSILGSKDTFLKFDTNFSPRIFHKNTVHIAKEFWLYGRFWHLSLSLSQRWTSAHSLYIRTEHFIFDIFRVFDFFWTHLNHSCPKSSIIP